MDLVRGQRVKLANITSSPQFDVTLRAAGIDAAQLQFLCLLLDDKGVAAGPHPVVHDGKTRSDCGTVMLKDRQIGEQTFFVDLAKVPADVMRVLFAVAIESPPNHPTPIHADLIREGSVVVKGDGQPARHVFKGSDFEKETALELIDVYRKDNVWRVAVVAAGFVGGLPALLSRYHAPLVAGPVPAGALRGPDQGGGPGISPAPEGITVPGTWPGGQAPTLPQGLVPCVALVIVRTHAGETHSGTAFAIGPGGFCLTCHHVIENAENVSLCFEGTRTLRPCEVIASDPDSDLALIWIADRNGSPHWMMLADPLKEPQLGEDLGLLGYPLGINLGLSVTYSQGIVNSLRRKGELPVLQIDTGAAPGSSGGPVFRRSDGRVVGILTSGLNPDNAGMHINFAIGMRAFWRLGWLTLPS
jgi:stress response protein SCP2